MREAPPTAAELDEAKNELVAGKLRERETIEGRGFALGYALRIKATRPRPNRTRRPEGGHRRRRAAGGAEVPRPASGA